jgi:hypothetical protein
LTEIDKFKVLVSGDKFDLEISQLKKRVKEAEQDDDKCVLYEILAKIEDLELQKTKNRPRATTRILEENPAKQFKNHGKYNLETLLWYLWDNADVQAEFIHNYLIPECNDYLQHGD